MAFWILAMAFLLLAMLILPVGLFISGEESQPSPIHIFLSFRGTDTRETFTSLLYDALVRAGFNVFMDDESIRAGQEIDLVIPEAIERSLGAAVIFSRDFASSEWCLDELVLIVDRKKTLGPNYVFQPIYVDGVQPYEVRSQRGSYGKAFAKHKRSWDFNKLKVWREALTQVAGYRGSILKGKWSKFINDIVEEIRQEFRTLGITVNPPCCQYHSSRMDRVHAIYESIKKLTIIGNCVFLLNEFWSSCLFKKLLCTQFVLMVVENGLRVWCMYGNREAAKLVVIVLCTILLILAFRKGISEKKPSTMFSAFMLSTKEASKKPATVSTIIAAVRKSFVATMNKARAPVFIGAA